MSGAFGSNVTAGNRIVLVSHNNDNTGTGTGGVTTLSNTGTAVMGTWNKITQGPNVVAGGFSEVSTTWTARVNATGTLTPITTSGHATSQLSYVAREYSGLHFADDLTCVDISAVALAASVNGGVTTGANELVVVGGTDDGVSGTPTVAAGYGHFIFSGSSSACESGMEDKDSGAAASTVNSANPAFAGTGIVKYTHIIIFKLPVVLAGQSIAPGRTWQRRYWKGHRQTPLPLSPIVAPPSGVDPGSQIVFGYGSN
ncbi:MAG: hypothetical protein DLM66_00140 [Candidatus Dormiibacter spiritus]|nr:MAG: hypothetical protein DLM66_00140 [Candidatus Dormibacteraeota bacterium]